MTANIITTGPNVEPSALQDMAGRINQEHAAATAAAQTATAAAQTAIGHALQAGRLLLQVKAQLPHGEFLTWLRSNCTVKERQARNYIRLAKKWPAIEAKTAPGADLNLTVKGALRLLDERPSETPTVETGDAQVRINALFGLPDELQADATLTNATGEMLLEITPCRQAGFFYVAAYRDLDTDNTEVVYTRRGIAAYAAGFGLRGLGVDPGALLGDWQRGAFDGELPWYVKADDTSVPGRCRDHAYHGGQR